MDFPGYYIPPIRLLSLTFSVSLPRELSLHVWPCICLHDIMLILEKGGASWANNSILQQQAELLLTEENIQYSLA